MCTMTIAATLAAVAIPQLLGSIDRSRALAAARYLSARMALARTQAVRRSATVALRFDEDQRGFTFGVFVDGNGNGVRTGDISTGIDTRLDPPTRLSDLFPGVTIALSEGSFEDPVRIGSTSLMSFTPLGTATSGTIYLRGRDGSQFAVRVLGATGRTRVLRYATATREWTDRF
jgi:type II secretory pathway pseudopilin PulG